MLKEIDIKNALRGKESKINSPIYKICQKDSSTIVVDELCINNSTVRADMVAINGELHCFEIKSDADTFKRLDNQMSNYLNVFDQIYFITTEKHIEKIANSLPECVGVYEIKIKNGNISFERLKAAQKNINTNNHSILNLLWNIEIKYLMKSINLKGYSKMTHYDICNAILDIITEEDLRYYVRSMLKLRAEKVNWKVNHTKELYDEYVQFLSTHQNFQFLTPSHLLAA